MKLGTWLLGMVEPMIGRILASLGFSVVTIVGVEAVVTQLRDEMVANMNALPAEMLNFALYLWIGKGLGLIFGAIATRLTLWSIQHSTSILGKGNG